LSQDVAFSWTTTASPTGNYTISIPTTIVVSGSSWYGGPLYGGVNYYKPPPPYWNNQPWTGSGTPTQYGRWVGGTGSTWWEEHIPDSRIPTMIPIKSKKDFYIVREEYARPYDLYDWIKLNMWEKEGKIERYWGDWSLRDKLTGSWV
jgi:hypothetical protein